MTDNQRFVYNVCCVVWYFSYCAICVLLMLVVDQYFKSIVSSLIVSGGMVFVFFEVKNKLIKPRCVNAPKKEN